MDGFYLSNPDKFKKYTKAIFCHKSVFFSHGVWIGGWMVDLKKFVQAVFQNP